MKVFSVVLATLFAAVAVAGPVEIEKRCVAAGGVCGQASQCCSGACGMGPTALIGKCSV